MTATPTHDGTLRIECDICHRQEDTGMDLVTNDAIDDWLKQHGWRSVFRDEGAYSDVEDFCPECVAQGGLPNV